MPRRKNLKPGDTLTFEREWQDNDGNPIAADTVVNYVGPALEQIAGFIRVQFDDGQTGIFSMGVFKELKQPKPKPAEPKGRLAKAWQSAMANAQLEHGKDHDQKPQ